MFRRAGIAIVLMGGDIILIAGAMILASWLRPQLEIGKPIPADSAWLTTPVYLLILLVWGLSFLLADVYSLRKNLRFLDEVQRLLVGHVVATFAFAGVLYFTYRDISRLQVVTFALIALALLLSFRVIARLILYRWGNHRYGTRQVLIVGATPTGHRAAEAIAQSDWTGLKLAGFVDDDPLADTHGHPHLGPLSQITTTVQQRRINEVILALPREAHAELVNLVVGLQEIKVNVRVVPDFFDLVFIRSAVEDLGDMALVTLKEPALAPSQRLAKRLFDLVLSSIGLVVSLPFMAVIALGIRLDSPGPIFFRQQRVGENGRIFGMLKFRTMVHNAETRSSTIIKVAENGEPLHKFYDDPRVTRFGRFLRRTSLDELPQFFNILKGEMSLVGPRPELPWLVDRYEPWQHKRFEVPQGLTGWWQVNGRADKPMHLNTQDDLYYIKNYSLWLDIQILWRTVIVVFSQRGSF
jgi:exopolysaccharide biosynthesis polyprenyl glycosylphosphotransferase